MLFSRRSESSHHPAPVPAGAAARMLERERAPAVAPAGGSPIASVADGARTQSFIDSSLTIVGDLHSAGDVRIDGRICGNVRCAQLILGQEASITGAVIAEQAIVRGRIIGTIRSPVVVIQDTAHVESEVTYGSLAIDDGAFFEGAVHRRDNPLEEETAASPLRDLQRAVQTTKDAPGECRTKSTETTATPRPALPEPTAGNGRAPIANGRAPAANEHTQTG
jgi:cytoskeletal protein CcmA (bactofilin family)